VEQIAESADVHAFVPIASFALVDEFLHSVVVTIVHSASLADFHPVLSSANEIANLVALSLH